MSSSTTAAATTTATATVVAANFATSLPPPALPALPPHPTRAMVALSLLAARRVPILRPGRTTNPARPANLKAKLS